MLVTETQLVSKTISNRGAAKRARFSFGRKLEIVGKVLQLQSTKHTTKQRCSRKRAIERVSEETGISPTTIVIWIKNQEQIRCLAACSVAKTKKARYNRFWLQDLRYLEEVLAREVRKRRKLGHPSNVF